MVVVEWRDSVARPNPTYRLGFGLQLFGHDLEHRAVVELDSVTPRVRVRSSGGVEVQCDAPLAVDILSRRALDDDTVVHQRCVLGGGSWAA